MSDNSRDNTSGSSHRGFIGRRQAKGFQADDFKKGLGRVTKSMGAALQNVFSAKSDASVYSKGVRELDDYGYEKFNLDDDGGEIFISRVPDKALFNDGEPVLVRATSDVFYSTSEAAPAAAVEKAAPEAEAEGDISRFFGNVTRGTLSDTEFHATVGKVTEDGTIEPTPVNDAFLKRMVHSTNERPAPRMAMEDEPENVFVQIDDDVDVPVTAPVEEAVEDVAEETVEDVAEETVEEIIEEPAPAISNSFLSRMARPAHTEFIIDPEEAEEAPVEEPAIEDDYSWVEVPVTEDVPAEAPVEEAEEIIEVPVVAAAEEIVEASVEEPAIEDIVEDIVEASVEEIVAEEPAEIPVEETVEEPAQIEVPVAEEAEDIADEPAIEAPVEDIVAETPVAVMELPKIEIGEPEGVTGLTVEGSEPSSEAEAVSSITINENMETAVTGAAAMAPKSSGLRCGISEDGEALPPMSDPVVRRPRSMRFRFSNGVLQNVDSEKVEPREELRDPLA